MSWIRIEDVEIPITSMRIESGELHMTASISGPVPACKRAAIYTVIGDDGEVFGRGVFDQGWPRLYSGDTLIAAFRLKLKDKWIEQA